jgi:hypothetical protein
MKEYHKIQTMFKREKDKPCRIIYGEWTLPEFEYLKDNQWDFTEKVDGTNIRVMFDGNGLRYGGKTDAAQTPCDLIERLRNIFEPKLSIIKEMFPAKENTPIEVCFYGEGYGAGIQKGGYYKATKDFVLFDIKIGNFWLYRENVKDIANKLTLDIVPVVGNGTLEDGIKLVKDGFKSTWGDFIAEGIVARPKVELTGRYGRIITKIKHKDFF